MAEHQQLLEEATQALAVYENARTALQHVQTRLLEHAQEVAAVQKHVEEALALGTPVAHPLQPEAPKLREEVQPVLASTPQEPAEVIEASPEPAPEPVVVPPEDGGDEPAEEASPAAPSAPEEHTLFEGLAETPKEKPQRTPRQPKKVAQEEEIVKPDAAAKVLEGLDDDTLEF